MQTSSSNFHAEYMDVTQYWSPVSQPFAGADQLITLLSEGWQMGPTVKREQKQFAIARSVDIFHIELERSGEKIIMPVICNPYIERIISANKMTIVDKKQ